MLRASSAASRRFPSASKRVVEHELGNRFGFYRFIETCQTLYEAERLSAAIRVSYEPRLTKARTIYLCVRNTASPVRASVSHAFNLAERFDTIRGEPQYRICRGYKVGASLYVV